MVTWEKVPPPNEYQLIPVSSIEDYAQWMDAIANMTEEQQRAWLQAVLDTMTFEEQAEFLRRLDENQ